MKKEIAKTIKYLEEGKIILCPSDTLWGISCDATNFDAVQKIFILKKRADSKSLIVLVSSIKMLKTLTENTFPNVEEINSKFKKPVSIIFPDAKNLAKNTIAKDGSIAIRVVKEGFCKDLIDLFGKPIVSTSANISGQKTAFTFEEIDNKLKNKIDFIVNKQYDHTTQLSSTIIKITEKKVEIIRD